jgi:hypothetical protein
VKHVRPLTGFPLDQKKVPPHPPAPDKLQENQITHDNERKVVHGMDRIATVHWHALCTLSRPCQTVCSHGCRQTFMHGSRDLTRYRDRLREGIVLSDRARTSAGDLSASRACRQTTG